MRNSISLTYYPILELLTLLLVNRSPTYSKVEATGTLANKAVTSNETMTSSSSSVEALP